MILHISNYTYHYLMGSSLHYLPIMEINAIMISICMRNVLGKYIRRNMRKPNMWPCITALSGHSGSVDAQADLSHCFPHTHLVWFCHFMTPIMMSLEYVNRKDLDQYA